MKIPANLKTLFFTVVDYLIIDGWKAVNFKNGNIVGDCNENCIFRVYFNYNIRNVKKKKSDSLSKNLK